MASHILDRAAVNFASTERLASLKEWFVVLINRRRERARIARELLSCSNRELFDLGISRGDIPAIINGTYRRD
jgi:uncharacterized protein YjiS (DUF1127 family)